MPKTLLLADDSVTIQKVVGITFANEDVELVTVDNGDDALVRARQLKPDLVLADIGMPGLNGYELCGAIRRDPQLGHVPVLLLTGTFETYDEEKAREVGANGHIAKPFEAQALVDRVFALLAQAAAPRPAAPAPAAPVARPAAATTPTPTPRPAAPQAPRPAASPVAPPRPAAPPVAPPQAAATAHPEAPRPRPELPPVPGTSTARPAQRPAGAPTPRPSAPFEFELPAEPAAAPARPAAPAPPAPLAAPAPDAHTPVGEAMWEAEPELEAVEAVDETPIRRDEAAPDATRLFAPDLLGRAARLPEPPPEVPDPPAAPRGARGDFSFGDLDFEEPTGPANPHQSQIFGDSFGGSNEATVLADPLAVEPLAVEPIAVEPAEAAEAEALADPLYSQTRFLDPHAPAPATHFDTPNPAAAPPLPDLLAGEEITQPAEDDSEPLELAEADLEPEPLEEDDPFAQPFSPETAAALSAPEFQPHEAPRAQTPREYAATRLMMDAPAQAAPTELPEDMPAARRLPLPEVDTAPSLAPVHAPAPPPAATVSTAVTLPPRESRPAVDPARAALAPMIDSTQLAQVVEKVAWEAFGALSEQVVGEVMKRVEAVVWEVVPQLCERLIQEEIARLKAELPE